MKKKLITLIANRKAALAKAEGLVNTAETAKRELTAEESTQYDAHLAEVKRIDGDITRARDLIAASEAQNELENGSNDPRIVSGVHTGDEVDDVGANTRKNLAKYSFIKAFAAALPDGKLDGIEKEMHEEAKIEARNTGQAVKGIGIPQLVLNAGGTSRFRNAHSATGGTGGSEGGMLVTTELYPLIDFLRESLVFSRLGVTMLGGLKGDVQFPKVIRGTRPTNKSETGTADSYSATFGSIKLSPKRLPVQLSLTEQLLIQTDPSVEARLRAILGFELASAMEYLALFGTGAASQPLGVFYTSGVGLASLATDGAAPTRAMVLELEGDLDDSNAPMGTRAFVTNTKVKRTLKQVRLDSSNTDSQYVWSRMGDEVEGHPGVLTNNVLSNLTKGSGTNLSALFFGNWGSLMLGQWGGLNIILDQYTGAATGEIKLTMSTYSDSALEHPEAFAVCKDIITV